MPRFRTSLALLTPVVMLTACAQTPIGPSVAAIPGPNKPYEVFQSDQAMCKRNAESQVSGQAQDANMRGIGAAALTTVLGTGLGAVIGGGHGAGIGAASGLVGGTGIGAITSDRGGQAIQQRYDIAYSQCMYSRGNQVAGAGAPASMDRSLGRYR